jgi:hypothetical protein
LPQPFSGSVPFARFVHVPTLFAMLQALHAPVQLLLQHTPSTQFPEPHSQLCVQTWPNAFFTPAQALPEQ